MLACPLRLKSSQIYSKRFKSFHLDSSRCISKCLPICSFLFWKFKKKRNQTWPPSSRPRGWTPGRGGGGGRRVLEGGPPSPHGAGVRRASRPPPERIVTRTPPTRVQRHTTPNRASAVVGIGGFSSPLASPFVGMQHTRASSDRRGDIQLCQPRERSPRCRERRGQGAHTGTSRCGWRCSCRRQTVLQPYSLCLH